MTSTATWLDYLSEADDYLKDVYGSDESLANPGVFSNMAMDATATISAIASSPWP